MNRRRLEAETLWDFIHATAGTLNLKLGGRPVMPPLADDEMSALREPWQWTVSADPQDHTRRGLYILVRRNFRFPMFEVFDSPVNSVSSPRRDVTDRRAAGAVVAQQSPGLVAGPAIRRPPGARSGNRSGRVRRSRLGRGVGPSAQRNRKIRGAAIDGRASCRRGPTNPCSRIRRPTWPGFRPRRRQPWRNFAWRSSTSTNSSSID